ncbi:MAG TPA: glycosyltransferase family 2 protein [Candidatus Nanoarchaeia archaeon]|nr:glycosyltransferase family 2 protein [Candidatus Nanoarchaeia archaeon]
MKKEPLVCIVIVNWNGGQKIKNCLESLKKTSYKNYKVILVDNGSTDNSIAELKKINSKADVIKLDKNYGYTIGTNNGWKYALKKYDPKYICAMDSDIVTIQPNWLTLEIEELEKEEKNVISCGKLVFEDNRLQLLYAGRNFGDWSERDEGQYDFVMKVPAVGGACIIFKTTIIKKQGYYDENFFYGPNDIDYCLRATKAGYNVIYNGLAKSIHIGSSSYHASAQTKIFEAQVYGNLLLQLRHHGSFAWLKMLALEVARVFVTKKQSYVPATFSNLNFHLQFPLRSWLLVKAAYQSIRNKNNIINSEVKYVEQK